VGAYASGHGVNSQCLGCLEANCCNELLGCYNDASCIDYTNCYTANCAGSDLQSCGCNAQYPQGMAAFDGYLQCVINQCEKECVTVTVTSSSSGGPPGGSSGGQGGSSSGTSSSSSGAGCGVSGDPCVQTTDCCNTLCDPNTFVCQ